MRIVSGQAGGIELSVPKGIKVRPTTARSRQSLFDSLGSFNSLRVADLFAGSGALGLEAASRGATEVTFVEKNSRHCGFIKKNINRVEAAGVSSNFSMFRGDVRSFIRKSAVTDTGFNLYFIDPPYAEFKMYFKHIVEDKAFAEISGTSRLVWEFPYKTFDQSVISNRSLWQIEGLRNCGGTNFLLMKRRENQ